MNDDIEAEEDTVLGMQEIFCSSTSAMDGTL